MVSDFLVGVGVEVCTIVGTKRPAEQREEVLSEFVFEFEVMVVFGAVYAEAEIVFLAAVGVEQSYRDSFQHFLNF